MRSLRIFLLYVLVAIGGRLCAQYHHEFLATMNYAPFSYTRLDSIPGVSWIYDNTAYDENNKRFFFEGTNYSMSQPWSLYTLNALNGSVIYQQPIIPDISAGNTFCLQYDNSSDTLYCIYTTGGIFYSAWIDPASGDLHTKQVLTGVSGIGPGISTFDKHRHRLIFAGVTSSGTGMVVVDAVSGNLIASPSLYAGYIEFDNTHDHLYGIVAGNQFDSIEVMTGVTHFIAPVSPVGTYQNGIHAIDEANDHFIFCALAQSNNHDSLFTLDLQTGALLYQENYPYANSALYSGENLIFYRFDQSAGVLYALNWGIDSTINPEGIPGAEMTSSSFSIFPNPSNGIVHFQLPTPEYDQLDVCDATGKCLWVFALPANETQEIDLSFLPKGVYLLRLGGKKIPSRVARVVISG